MMAPDPVVADEQNRHSKQMPELSLGMHHPTPDETYALERNDKQEFLKIFSPVNNMEIIARELMARGINKDSHADVITDCYQGYLLASIRAMGIKPEAYSFQIRKLIKDFTAICEADISWLFYV